MALSSTNNRDDYVGTGSANAYDYTFKIFSDTDLLVTVRDDEGEETPLTLTNDYTVSGAGNGSGGSITLVDSDQDWLTEDGNLKEGYTLTIRRVRPLKQETSIRNQGSYFPEIHENVFDHMVMIAQQLQEQINRAIRVPETFNTSDFDPSLPSDVVGAPSRVIMTTADGDGLIMGPSIEEIQAAEGYAQAAEAARIQAEGAQAAAAQAVIDAQDAQAAAEAAQVAAEAAQAAAEEAATIAWSLFVSHEVTDGQSATDLDGETVDFDEYSSAVYDVEIIRGTTVIANGRLSIQNLNGTARVITGGFITSEPHGVTFSVSQNGTIAQLRAALDSGAGNGTIKLSRRLIPA